MMAELVKATAYQFYWMLSDLKHYFPIKISPYKE